tara:strand:- start:3843 stop:4358 length:516 start_codon:yes stop_codon:yes gene_type:complete
MSANEFWTNSDGLNVRFGLEKGGVAKEGVISTMGDESVLQVKIVGTDLGSADAPIATHPLAGIPTGAHLISATLYVTEAFTSGGSGTLTLGLWNDDGDGTFSVIDADGIDATIAKTALDAIGDHVACDGALVGTGTAAIAGTGDRPVFVSGYYATAAFTAGKADLIIKYRI